MASPLTGMGSAESKKSQSKRLFEAIRRAENASLGLVISKS